MSKQTLVYPQLVAKFMPAAAAAVSYCGQSRNFYHIMYLTQSWSDSGREEEYDTYQELHHLGEEHTKTDHTRLISNLKLL
jgi:hypothetical protein